MSSSSVMSGPKSSWVTRKRSQPDGSTPRRNINQSRRMIPYSGVDEGFRGTSYLAPNVGMGLKVLIDQVRGIHTSQLHHAFVESASSTLPNPKSDWYVCMTTRAMAPRQTTGFRPFQRDAAPAMALLGRRILLANFCPGSPELQLDITRRLLGPVLDLAALAGQKGRREFPHRRRELFVEDSCSSRYRSAHGDGTSCGDLPDIDVRSSCEQFLSPWMVFERLACHPALLAEYPNS